MTTNKQSRRVEEGGDVLRQHSPAFQNALHNPRPVAPSPIPSVVEAPSIPPASASLGRDSPTDDGTCFRGDGIHPDARETGALYCIKWGFIVCSTAALLIWLLT